MIAEVAEPRRIDGKLSYQAYCESCQDGVNKGTRTGAEAWADGHNASRHRAEVEELLAAARAVGPRG